MATQVKEATLHIPEVTTQTLVLSILGISPFVCNRMSEKAKHELLYPRGRMTSAEKQSNLKHDPPAEFRAAPYRLVDDNAPTLLAVTSTAFKGALCTAALDVPGTKKAQIGRLVYVQGDYTPIYGVPRLYMAVVRSADMNHTPDIRTRAIIPHWACQIGVTFVTPLLNPQAMTNLAAWAGITAGGGDGRPEKGKLNFGQWRIVNDDDPEFQRIIREGGRLAQQAAMDNPEPYDAESAEMLEFWTAEYAQRGQKHVTLKEEGEEEEGESEG